MHDQMLPLIGSLPNSLSYDQLPSFLSAHSMLRIAPLEDSHVSLFLGTSHCSEFEQGVGHPSTLVESFKV